MGHRNRVLAEQGSDNRRITVVLGVVSSQSAGLGVMIFPFGGAFPDKRRDPSLALVGLAGSAWNNVILMTLLKLLRKRL